MERYILIQEKTFNANNKNSEHNIILVDKYLNDLSVKLKNPNSVISKKINKIADKGFYNLIILKKPGFFCLVHINVNYIKNYINILRIQVI